MLDACNGGAWASTNFEGHTITERDLLWASLWAIQAAKRKHVLVPSGPMPIPEYEPPEED